MGSDPPRDRPGPPDAAQWRQLEPASLLVNLLPTLWRTTRNLWPLLLAIFIGGTVQGAVDLGFLGLFVTLAVMRTVLHYATLRYRMYAGNRGKP